MAIESKRLKIEPKTYSRRKSDKSRSNKRNSNSDDLPSPSKTSKSKGRYLLLTSNILFRYRNVSGKYVGPPSVILDNGSYTAKIGMSNDEPK